MCDIIISPLGVPEIERSGACAGFLKGVGEFLTALYAKPIGYQYRRFKTVD